MIDTGIGRIIAPPTISERDEFILRTNVIPRIEEGKVLNGNGEPLSATPSGSYLSLRV